MEEIWCEILVCITSLRSCVSAKEATYSYYFSDTPLVRYEIVKHVSNWKLALWKAENNLQKIVAHQRLYLQLICRMATHKKKDTSNEDIIITSRIVSSFKLGFFILNTCLPKHKEFVEAFKLPRGNKTL